MEYSMRLLKSVVMIIGLALLLATQAAAAHVPMYRYNKSGPPWDQFFTTNFNELGWGAGGYNYCGVAFYVSDTQDPGTTPLYRYFNRYSNTHFYTINIAELW